MSPADYHLYIILFFYKYTKKLSAILQVYFSLLSEDWKIATLDSFQLSSLYWCYIINSPPTFSFPYQVISTFYSFLQNVFIFKIQIISPYSLDVIWFLYELVKMPSCWAFLNYWLQGPGKQPHFSTCSLILWQRQELELWMVLTVLTKNEEANSKLKEELGKLEKIISSLWVSSSLPIKWGSTG